MNNLKSTHNKKRCFKETKIMLEIKEKTNSKLKSNQNDSYYMC